MRGGVRKNCGRKPKDKVARVPRTVRLDGDLWERLERLAAKRSGSVGDALTEILQGYWGLKASTKPTVDEWVD